MSRNFQIQQSGLELYVITDSLFSRLYSKAAKSNWNSLLRHPYRRSVNMNGVTEEKSEAWSLRELAKKRYKDFNLTYTLKYTKRSHCLDPNLNVAIKILTSFQILWVAAKSPDNWYQILQVESFAHINPLKKQYKKLVLLLHSNKNPYSDLDEVFKHVGKVY